MQTTVFQGEHLIWGNLGHAAVVLSFITSILSAVAFYFAEKNPLEKQWLRLGKFSFLLHSVSVLSIIGILFNIIHSHYFEYHYAWQHSSLDLPVYYMISCFWEGQEGSFLLWIFWQMVIGNILIRTAKNWTSPVMFVLMLSQIALTSMLLGIKIGFFQLGSTPFELLRVSDAMKDAPIFKMSDYLSKIKDGNGLNPLLQNYWMVIHPPTLFFGFATTVVPFAFAIAALWRKDFSGWIKPALPWALISIMVLGAGIIMGAFWAYESLSFGGYWAWDPVENASLIPWIVLIAGMHLMIIFNATGNALQAAFGFIIGTFILVLYATFLTRSGILGNSSVHAFTDLGMSGQLLLFVFLFIWLPLLLTTSNRKYFFINLFVFLLFVFGVIFSEKININKWFLIAMGFYGIASLVFTLVKKIPSSKKDDEIYTREFWMFIGALILGISSFQILLTTSIPVLNKLFDLKLAPPTDPISHYNKWQMPFAILVASLTAVAHVLKFKKNTIETLKKIGIHAGIALVVSLILMFAFKLIDNWIFIGIVFASSYAIIANASLLAPAFKGKFKVVGSSVAHIGFGVLLLGVLVSSANKKVISINESGFVLNPEFDDKNNMENIFMKRNVPVKMREYLVTYIGDSQQWVNTYYKVNYKKINAETGAFEYEFNLFPNAQVNPKMGFVANPDTKHYLSHDVFTYVSSVPAEKKETKYVNHKKQALAIGDTIYCDKAFVVLKDVSTNYQPNEKSNALPDELMLRAELEIHSLDKTYTVSPLYIIKGNTYSVVDAVNDELGLKFSFTEIDSNKKVLIETSEKDNSSDFIIMKAIIFPWINLVWAGTIIMLVGFFLSILKRMDFN